MMPFARLRLPIQTWICPISLLKSWTNQQLNPSIRRVRRIYLQMMPLRMMQPSILGDGDAATEGQQKTVEEDSCHPVDVEEYGAPAV